MDDDMGKISNQRKQSILLVVLVSALFLYSLTLLTLDYTVEGIGFSPFRSWSPFQTVAYAISGFATLVFFIYIDFSNRTLNLRGLIHVPLIMILTFFTVNSTDLFQIGQYSPLLEAFFVTGFAGIFLYGGLIGLYIAYLHARSNNNDWDQTLSDFIFRGMIVVIVAPMLLIMVFTAIIYLLLGTTPPLFPFYGEGTGIGALAAGAILSMYFGAKLVSRYGVSSPRSPKQVSTIDVIRNFLEGLSAFLCIGAAFSLMGGLLTDGIPPPLPIPLGIVILALLVTLPFSLFLSRNEIFEPVEEPQDEADTAEDESDL